MINVHIGDSYVLVTPHVPEDIKRVLTYWHRSLKYDEEQHQRIAKGESRRLFTYNMGIDPTTNVLGEQLVTFPGLANKIMAKLRSTQTPFKVLDQRTPRPPYDLKKAFSRLRDYQHHCVHDALWAGGGIISCPTGWGKTHVMGALIRAHDRDDMALRNTPMTVVITPGVDLAKKNYRDLAEDILPDRDVGLICTGAKRYSDDVQVVTPDSLHKVNLKECGLLIYDEVHTLTEKRAERVMEATHAMRYGVSATPSGRFDGADLMTEGVFGPVVYHRTYQEAIEDEAVVPIRVYWVEVPPPDGWLSCRSKDATYRNGVWRYAPMHQTVSDIWNKIPDDMQTLGIVDKIEHMNRLAPFLDGTTMVHAETSAAALTKKRFANISAVSKKEREAVYKKMESGALKRTVSSGIYRTGVNFPKLTVLVNLAGMGSEIIAGQLPGRASRNIEGKECAFLIDFWRPWDIVVKEDLTSKPSFIFRDDMKREQMYAALGFEQQWVGSDLSKVVF